MNDSSASADIAADPATVFSLRHRVAAYGVHCYTALGLLCAALAAANILQADNRTAFLWMIVAVLIDATDGTLARKLRVKEAVPNIDGRKLDDIVDYLNYTFLPLLMIGWAGWLPEPIWLWASIPLIASAFAFSNIGAKEEDDGFFLGFPSYWNIFAFYVAVWLRHYGDYVVLAVALVLSLLSVLPVRFVYPNRPPKWKGFFLGGATVTLAFALLILLQYPDQNGWLVALSLVYPAIYVILSVYLDLENRRERRAAAAGRP